MNPTDFIGAILITALAIGANLFTIAQFYAFFLEHKLALRQFKKEIQRKLKY